MRLFFFLFSFVADFRQICDHGATGARSRVNISCLSVRSSDHGESWRRSAEL